LRAWRSNLTINNLLKLLDSFVAMLLAMAERVTFYETIKSRLFLVPGWALSPRGQNQYIFPFRNPQTLGLEKFFDKFLKISKKC